MILNIENINKFYNGNHILKNISLSVEDNDRIGLIGVNGCGKSTLLRIITQIEDFDKIDGIQSSLSISANKTLGFLKQNSVITSYSIHYTKLYEKFYLQILTASFGYHRFCQNPQFVL